MLRVIDIASHQAGINVWDVDCDVVIIKATGGTSYVNPYWRDWANATLASGKQLGLYHYAMEYGNYNDASAEANFFLNEISDYIGRAVPVLDFEADAQSLPVSWAREWLDVVAGRTGSRPFFYCYASYLNSRDHSEITNYPLWMASYLNRYDGAGWVSDPENRWDTGSWPGMTMYQYTSTGYVGGYDNRLDLSIFYGGREDWQALCSGSAVSIGSDLKIISNRGGDVYRLYNTTTGDHLYTNSAAERDALSKSQWNYEGIAFKAPIGTEPVFRMYNPNAGDHFWTASFGEAEGLQKAGWIYEGVPFFANKDGKPVYRLYNPSDGDHFLTASAEEKDNLSKIGWKYEGVAFKV